VLLFVCRMEYAAWSVVDGILLETPESVHQRPQQDAGRNKGDGFGDEDLKTHPHVSAFYLRQRLGASHTRGGIPEEFGIQAKGPNDEG